MALYSQLTAQTIAGQIRVKSVQTVFCFFVFSTNMYWKMIRSSYMYTHQHVLDDQWVFNDDHHIYICRGIVPHEEREWMPGEKEEFMGTDCNCTLHWQLHCDAQHTALETALYTALHCAKHCTAMH